MKILITTHHLLNFSGSKTWVFVVAKELSKTHEVTVAAPDSSGDMAAKIRDILHIPVVAFDEINQMFDLGVLAQQQSNPVVKWCKKTIFIVHGPTDPDKPIPECDVIVSCSPVGAVKWGVDTILPQPIDTEWYNIPKKVLYVSSFGKLFPIVKEICDEFDWPCVWCREIWELKEWFEWADVVVAASRSALEAISCGKPTIIADYKPVFGKPLMDETYNLCWNCSGLQSQINLTKERLRKELLGDRATILKNHSVSNFCEKLLAL